MASSAKFCPQCGNELPEPNPPFCSQCGAKINVVITATPPIETDSIISKPQRVSCRRAIELGFRGYVDFSGRSSRAEFWWWVLFVQLGNLIVMGLSQVLAYGFGLHWFILYEAEAFEWGLLDALFYIGVFLPTVAVTCRRFHDINHTVLLAWIFRFIFLPIQIIPANLIPEDANVLYGIYACILVPVTITTFVWAVSKGHENANKYGPPVYSQT